MGTPLSGTPSGDHSPPQRYATRMSPTRYRLEGTCTWLSADLGCGKSVIVSFLVTLLKNQTNATVCYLFFKDDSEEQKSATFALSAILHQLFEQKNALCRYAEDEFRARGKKLTEEVDTLWDILVKAVAKGKCGDVICVVDALDECEGETLNPLIRHVTLTSRPYHKIERELGSPATAIRLRGEDEVVAITADVTRVIDDGIKNLETYRRRPGGRGYLRNFLVSSADRAFLLVSLILGILKEGGGGSPGEFTSIVSAAPCGPAELYTKILNKSTDQGKARRILNIVVAAARPLTLREMNIAFRIRQGHSSTKDLGDLTEGFERTVKGVCGLFVRVIDSKIYPVHQTAREFLIRGSLPGQGNWQYTLEFGGILSAVGTEGRVSWEAVHDYLQKYGIELFDFTRLICEVGSKHCLTWFWLYWVNHRPWSTFPEDLTHLMIASLLGQGTAVERLLGEGGGGISARSALYGTALNIATIWKMEEIVRKLMQGNVKAYIDVKEYNISHMKRPLGLKWLIHN
ncbi:hypothetical protein C7212DRAFT_356879 [Tuber magnatum]|uniref:NACHT domain-containing protein n=1 Tax=Tuber magnatum TaxID=42249 RepID=A0A317SVJ9_9PEZI|nr:hypothetical protein C7212DRAFT_356879 [Tuber magnatum]